MAKKVDRRVKYLSEHRIHQRAESGLLSGILFCARCGRRIEYQSKDQRYVCHRKDEASQTYVYDSGGTMAEADILPCLLDRAAAVAEQGAKRLDDLLVNATTMKRSAADQA
ncbi:MAG: zinc ribbon domain-containing protein [Planctomycetia bacterium]|nr:zinc ribbon domain-containing protein [Planctomycetia bacterium]